MAIKSHFTKAALLDLKATDKQQYFHDAKEPRLGLYVTVNGSKSFFARLTIAGKTVRRAIGKFPDMSVPVARKKAIEAAAIAAGGEDPLAIKREKQLVGVTLQAVLDLYMEDRGIKQSTVKSYRSATGNTFKDWMSLPLASITEDRVKARYRQQAAVSAGRTDTAFVVLKAVFNYARSSYKRPDYTSNFPHNPVQILDDLKMRKIPSPRKGVITDRELPVLWEEVMSWKSDIARNYFLFVLFTGCRREEALSLQWEHVNAEAGSFTLLDTKNGSDVVLPMPGFMEKLLIPGTGYVFPSVHGKGRKFQPERWVGKLKKVIPGFMIHDLRRSFVTRANGLDINIYSVKGLVNHSTGSDITGRYDVPDILRLQVAAGKVESSILEITSCL